MSSRYSIVLLCVALCCVATTAVATSEESIHNALLNEINTFATRNQSKFNLWNCSQCKVIMGDLVDISENHTLEKELRHALDQYCATTFKANIIEMGLCDLAVKYILSKAKDIRKDVRNRWNVPLVFCGIIYSCDLPCCPNAPTLFTPEQVHLSFAEAAPTNPFNIRATWVTQNGTDQTIVEWWWSDAGTTVHSSHGGATRTYSAGNWMGTIHSAVMTNLPPNTSVTYRVGGRVGAKYFWSPQNYTYMTLPDEVSTLRVVAIADMGVRHFSNDTVDDITRLVQRGEVDLVVHYGDISYADDNQQDWDEYFRKIEPFASRVPYMVVPGNHEIPFDFASYKARFWMPDPGHGAPAWPNGLYYAFTVGPATFVMCNTESITGDPTMDDTQLHWLDTVLDEADNTTARQLRPWLIMTQHRPLYCTERGGNCHKYGRELRAWEEHRMHKHHVDLHIAGHVHTYERTFPLRDGELVSKNYTASEYTRQNATVFVVNGAAGNFEGNSECSGDEPWSGFHSKDVGYAKLTMQRRSLRFAFHRSKTDELLDVFTIEK